MDVALKDRIERRRQALYLAVKNARPDLYRKAVEVGHLGLSSFIRDENKRAAEIEAAVMWLIAEAAEIDTSPQS